MEAFTKAKASQIRSCTVNSCITIMLCVSRLATVSVAFVTALGPSSSMPQAFNPY